MTTFRYRARDKKGNLVRGSIAAEDLIAAKKFISQKDLITLSIKESKIFDVVAVLQNFFKKPVSTEDLIMFSRQMQIVYNVGIPIMQGLQLVLDQTTNPDLRIAIVGMAKDISEGMSLYQAMSKHDKIFDPVYINLIRVGEATGNLASMLERASKLVEDRAELRAKIKTATFYPKIVIGFFSVSFITVLYGVLPRLKQFFTSIGGELPYITRMVMNTSDFFVSYWYVFALLVGGSYYLIRKALAVPEWRFEFDRFLFRLPIFGLLFQQIEVSTFCIVLDLLLRSGVTIIDAFTYVEMSSTNTAFSKDVANCRNVIERGGSLTESLANAETFPLMIKGLIGMGEEGGKLPDVLQQISHYYKVQIDHRISNLSKLIEPLLLLFIFTMVGILALAVFMPMWSMSSAMRHR